MAFHTRLRDLRTDCELTQADIAKVLNTSFQYYSKYEAGVRPMPLERYAVLAEFYNISLDYLCGLSDSKRKLHPGLPSKVIGVD